MSGKQYFQIYGEQAGPLPESEPLFKELEILKQDDIFKLNIANFVYSTLDNESPQIFSNWFTYCHLVHEHGTRTGVEIIRSEYFDVGYEEPTRSLHTQRPHLENYGKKMIQVYGPTLWNSLPDEIKESPSINTFKYNIKKYFIGKYDNRDQNEN